VRQFRRLHLRRRAQKVVPPAFTAWMIAAHAAHPWAGYSDASIVHEAWCTIRRGETCNCVPDVLLHMSGGQIMTVDPAGRVRKEIRQ
jgi:hypothetical protein